MIERLMARMNRLVVVVSEAIVERLSFGLPAPGGWAYPYVCPELERAGRRHQGLWSVRCLEQAEISESRHQVRVVVALAQVRSPVDGDADGR